MTLIYRMEDAHHHGPFNSALAKAYGNRTVMGMWRHVPWADADFDGLSALDAEHPHHITDVLHLSPMDAYFAEYMELMPLPGNWSVGCISLQQFFHWFPKPSLPDFAKCGLELSIYDCTDEAIKRGRYQVMFDPARAILDKQEPLTCPQLLAA